MWDIVWVSPQEHRSVSVSHHFLLQAPQCPCSMQKRFSREHCCRGRSKLLPSETHCSFSQIQKQTNKHGRQFQSVTNKQLMSLHSAKLVNLSSGLRLKLGFQMKLWSKRKTKPKSDMTHCQFSVRWAKLPFLQCRKVSLKPTGNRQLTG